MFPPRWRFVATVSGSTSRFKTRTPDDILFGIVRRSAAMIMLKDVGVDPLPNCTRDVKKGWARWDAYPEHLRRIQAAGTRSDS
jgi:hypothetical protein